LELVEVIEDAAVSAAKLPLDKRPGGARLLKTLEEDESIAHVVGLKLDRLFRRTEDCLNTVRVWDGLGVSLRLIDLGGQELNTGSPIGRLFLTIMVALSEWEAAIITERIVTVISEKKRNGEPLGTAPYGKRWVPKGPDNAKGYLENVPEEQEAMRLILRHRANGLTVRAIAKRLNEAGLAARGKAWHPTTIARIIKRGREEATQ
jgi:DNA invertase Pin-like site-specific DNA recombinase